MSRSDLTQMAELLLERQQAYIAALLEGDAAQCDALGMRFRGLGEMFAESVEEYIVQGSKFKVQSAEWGEAEAEAEAVRDERLQLVLVGDDGEPRERLYIVGLARQARRVYLLTSTGDRLPLRFGPSLGEVRGLRCQYAVGTLLHHWEALCESA